MRDLKNALNEFFENETLGMEQRYRVEFVGDGNYLPVLRDRRSEVRPDNLVPRFWQPHKWNMHNEDDRPTLILFFEPQFFIDAKGTYFRNPGVNTHEEAAQLGFGGELKKSYSFVPSGIVQAMLHVMKALRPDPNHNVYPRTSIIKHATDTPPDHENLVVLATPTSKKLVATLESGFSMRTSARGVSLNGAEPLEDTAEPIGTDSAEMVKWGVLTRRPHRVKDRTVTLLSAKHGRTVEAMAQFLTNPADIPALAIQLQRPRFPQRLSFRTGRRRRRRRD